MRLTRRGRDGHRTGPRVFLHVGAPATGSTYLRGGLVRHRRRLARQGVLVPAGHVGGRPDHRDAALDVLGLADRPGAWDRLAQAARDWRRGTVVVSHELFADADEEQVARVLAGLGQAEVHVVYAARDLGRHLPLAWQEWVRHGGTVPFGSYVDQVAARTEHREAEVFWRSHDVGAVLGRWGAQLPAERVHVLTVPPGRDGDRALWGRFVRTLGLDPRRFKGGPVTRPQLWSHAALDAVCLVNAETGTAPDPALLAAAAALPGPAPVLPARVEALLREEGERVVAAVKDGGYRVVGDVTDLRPELTPPPAGTAVEPTAGDVLAAQTRLLAALLSPRG